MSFFQKLMSYKPYKRQTKKEQQAPQEPSVPVYTRDEEGFVNVYAVDNGEDEENADVSRWEMADVLSHKNKTVVSNRIGYPSNERTARLRHFQESSRSRPAIVEDASSFMEDSRELEKFDDKKSRVLKGSRRRKYVSFELNQ